MDRASLVLAAISPLLLCVFTGCGALPGSWSSGGEQAQADAQNEERESVVLFGDVVLRPTGRPYQGKASWYSVRTNHGTRTASGERLSDREPTAAHRSLPFGTKVRVTNMKNGRSEVVRITDRGPYIAGRIIDVTIGTAERLGMVVAGVVPVKMEVLEMHPEPPATDRRRNRVPSIWSRRKDDGELLAQESRRLTDA
jgi:rare lipoprotein A (peptidoglycan hydrolase)